MRGAKEEHALRELSALYGLETAFRDVDQRLQTAPVESLVEVLSRIGVETVCPRSATRLLRERRGELARKSLPDYVVAWEGRLASDLVREKDGAEVELQNGHVVPLLPVVGSGARQTALPFGYHTLRVCTGGREEWCRVVSAPHRAYESGWRAEEAPSSPQRRPRSDAESASHEATAAAAMNGGWGLFAPLYALRGAEDWGVGDLNDLARLLGWTAGLGGRFVATLPLLSGFLDEPFEPSPYMPVSRLFWNELYADLSAVPEWVQQEPLERLRETALLAETALGGPERMADYRRVFAVKRQAARLLAERFFAEDLSARRGQLAAFIERKPEVLAYARFRARVDRERRDWRGWSSSAASGTDRARPAARPTVSASPSTASATSAVASAGLDVLGLDDLERIYLYWQWVTHEQLVELGARRDASLGLDFPIGVHPGGFDAWRYPDCFVRGVSLGAPPDTFFRGGQDWNTPPLHPGILAAAGLDYLVGCLRTHMQVAGSLRIDHVMGLHRQYWIPQGASATEGVYVRYPADLLYAVLALESRWCECVVVGEDLGTVSPEVRPAMSRHGVRRTFVLQLEADPLVAERGGTETRLSSSRTASSSLKPPRPPRLSAAMLNTHDLPPFAAYVRGDTGRLLAALLAAESGRRLNLDAFTVAELRTEVLLYLAASDAESLQVNIEDLWLETEPQNVPGSQRAGLDWRRRCRRSLDQIMADRSIHELLTEIDQTRRRARPSRPRQPA